MYKIGQQQTFRAFEESIMYSTPNLSTFEYVIHLKTSKIKNVRIFIVSVVDPE
jgi:hypothetical protein